MSVRALSGPINKHATRRIPNASKLREYTAPAPIDGWNARDPLSVMGEKDAIILDNWFPEAGGVKIRRGHKSWATGMTGAVESLMAWNGPTSSALFAAADKKIFNVTTMGSVGAAVVTSLNSNRWQSTMFGTSAGAYLYMVNGQDAPRYFNGSSWVTPSLTGTTAANMIHVNAFKRRLFFAQKDSLSFWYLAVDSIAGPLTRFDLAPLASLGGYLVAMGTWTRDGGSGVDDFAVFITSKGQVMIFQGTDPGTANNWAHVGTFRVGAPLGRRCFANLGADLVVITEDGYGPLSRMMIAGRISERAPMSDKISGAVKEAVANGRDLFGWEPIIYPSGNMIMVNVPTLTTAHQHVSNATTGAWCRFRNWGANCFAIYDDKLWFGGNGTVYQADVGLDDAGSDITTSAKPAFNYFRNRGQFKRYAMVRPNLSLDGAINAAMVVNADFENTAPTETPSFTPGTGGMWDTAEWDVAEWADSAAINKAWQVTEGVGNCATLRMKTASQNGTITWNTTDWLWEPASGFIG